MKSFTVFPVAPADLSMIQPGEVYERMAFTSVQYGELLLTWIIQAGTILDPGSKYGIRVIRFVAKRKPV